MSDGRGKSSRASTAERKHVYPVNVDREIDRMKNEERGRERLPVREQLSRANRATCRHVNWLASLISILFGNLSRVKLRRATIDDNTGLRYTFPSPPPPPPPSLRLLTRHEFNSRGRSSYPFDLVGKSCYFASILFSFLFFFLLRFENLELIYSTHRTSDSMKKKIIDDPPFRDISFQTPPSPSSPVVGGFLVAAVSPNEHP